MVDVPDVDAARGRLDNLLKSIRNQANFADVATPNGKRSSSVRDDDEDESDADYSEHDDQTPARRSTRRSSSQKLGKFSPTKGPGSVSSVDAKKKRKSQKKIIFELRQKAFEIQNSGMEHGLYALCRIWMRGKHTKDSVVTGQPIDRTSVDMDQETSSAAKTITRKSE